jgi:isoleucyl-tRNA synthetase
VTIALKDEYKDLVSLQDSMKQFFIVARVVLTADTEGLDEYETSFVKAEKFAGTQCPRCWNYYEEDELVDGLCPRCAEAMK